MKFSIFRLPKMRQFDYKPLYFNPEKERLDQRKRQLLDDESPSNVDFSKGHALRMKGAMRFNHEQFADVARKENKKSNSRLIVIAIALSVFAYYLFHSSSAWFETIMHR